MKETARHFGTSSNQLTFCSFRLFLPHIQVEGFFCVLLHNRHAEDRQYSQTKAQDSGHGGSLGRAFCYFDWARKAMVNSRSKTHTLSGVSRRWRSMATCRDATVFVIGCVSTGWRKSTETMCHQVMIPLQLGTVHRVATSIFKIWRSNRRQVDSSRLSFFILTVSTIFLLGFLFFFFFLIRLRQIFLYLFFGLFVLTYSSSPFGNRLTFLRCDRASI